MKQIFLRCLFRSDRSSCYPRRLVGSFDACDVATCKSGLAAGVEQLVRASGDAIGSCSGCRL